MPDWYKWKILYFPFLFLFLIGFVLAVPPFSDIEVGTFTEGLILDYPKFNFYKANNLFELNIHVYNISTGFRVDNTSTSCEGHLYNSTGDGLFHIENAPTNQPNEEEFNLRMNDTSIIKPGFYGWSVNCNTSYLGGFASGGFEITETGKETGIDTEDELLIYFVFALAILFLIIAFWKEDQHLASISGILMVMLGVYILVNGFSAVDTILSLALGIVFICGGTYIFIRSNIENF